MNIVLEKQECHRNWHGIAKKAMDYCKEIGLKVISCIIAIKTKEVIEKFLD